MVEFEEAKQLANNSIARSLRDIDEDNQQCIDTMKSCADDLKMWLTMKQGLIRQPVLALPILHDHDIYCQRLVNPKALCVTCPYQQQHGDCHVTGSNHLALVSARDQYLIATMDYYNDEIYDCEIDQKAMKVTNNYIERHVGKYRRRRIKIMAQLEKAKTEHQWSQHKQRLLLNMVQSVPLNDIHCYFCALNSEGDCYKCSYAKHHGYCGDHGSDYNKIKEARTILTWAIKGYYPEKKTAIASLPYFEDLDWWN